MSKSNLIYPLEVETLSFTRDGNESPPQQQQQEQSFQPCLSFQNLFALTVAYASYYSHVTVPIAAICLVVVVILTLDFVASASTSKHVAMVKHEYSNTVHSTYELKMQQIDHWCLSVSTWLLPVAGCKFYYSSLSVLNVDNGSHGFQSFVYAHMCPGRG